MQFIPSTWSVVGVDADGDAQRNPQDINDAALATAVYLCSGDDDLSSEKGQRASVYRYNHSNDYVDLVLSIMQAYMDGDFSAVPTSTLTSGLILPDLSGSGAGQGENGGGKGGKNGGKGGGKGGSTATVKPTPTTQTTSPTATPTPTPTSSPTPTKQPTKEPTIVPTSIPTVSTTLPPVPTATITQTLTLVEATAQCVAQGVVDNPLTATNELLDCANALLAP
jgi:hypothetical protein